jgi:imidazolonepropionase-like amidohydrolase
VRIALVVLAACGSPQTIAPPAGEAPAGRTPDGAAVRIAITGETIAQLAPASATDATSWLWPPIVDSHVHLAFYDVADQLPPTGIAAAVDLAAPERSLGELRRRGGPEVVFAGPMLTHVDGYPLDAWGADGYGIGCDDAACVTAAVDRLAAAGARVIKIALDDDGLAPALVPVAVQAAHRKGLRVAVHALSNAAAALAADENVDLLAHTPVEPLADATVAAWSKRAVISTLAAFGSSAAAIENLRKLRAAGATVLYGTDLGNTRDVGPSRDEVALLHRAGLDDDAITAAMTTTPAAYWKLPFGAIAVGRDASFLVLDRDPRTDVSALLSPRAIYLRGRRVR